MLQSDVGNMNFQLICRGVRCYSGRLGSAVFVRSRLFC